MKERHYAKELTRDYLEYLGITNVTEDGRIFKGDKEMNQIETVNGYFNVGLYDPNLRQSVPMEERTNSTGQFCIGVHRIVYVWFNRIQPAGLVIDHRDSNKQNNHISNLRLLTPAENITKERPGYNTKEIKCPLNKPRSFYQDKLERYLIAYEEAKKAGDAEAAHSLRSNISQARARLRYYDSHLLEALDIKKAQEEAEALKKESRSRAAKKRELKADVDRAYKFYKELRDAYGKDDSIVKQYWGEWKLAIARYNSFCEKIASQTKLR